MNDLLKRFERQYETHNRIEISAGALLHNLQLFHRLTDRLVIPVLKSNAYGHGIEQVAQALSKTTLPYVAVDSYYEALRIRTVSKQPVLVMGSIKPENFARLTYDGFAFVVQDEAAIRALGATGKKVNIHLECNTGMNRYGAEPDELAKLTKLILSYRNLTLEGIMSHLADSDGDDPTTVNKAVSLFDECVDAIRSAGTQPTLIHVAQTAGSLKAKSKYANAIRLGIGLYGINPFSFQHTLHKKLAGLQPVLKLVSTITRIHQLNQGDQVSYNYTFTAPKPMTIGVLPIGYHEGVPRALSSVGTVKVGGQFTPVVGRVCMNHMMISLENIPAKLGDEVVIYSNNPADANAIDRVASEHNLFNYSILTGLSSDSRRILVD